MAEKIAYSKALNSAEVNIVENYLGAKYAISIANDKYAYDATASYDVIGIGQESDGNNLSAKGISPLGLSVGSLSTGEYVFAGHDNAGYSANTTDVPFAGWARFNQVWRSDITGTPGTVTVTFDVTQYGLGSSNSYKLLVDADGVFSAGATSYSGVYAGGTVTFTGVTLAAGSYFTLANSSTIILSTGTTTDWHTTTTWDCGCVPLAGTTVIIQNGHTVNINGQNASVANLTVNGTLSFGASDTLAITQNLTNTGTFTSGTGTVLLDGTTAQTLTGTLPLYNLKINNAAGVTNAATGMLSIGAGGFLDVQAGALATGDSLTLTSNATGTGAIANPTTGSITGKVAIQRYINEGTNGNSWYFLASAVTDGTLEDWNQEFEMQGFTGTDWTGGSSSVYYYDQNNIVTTYGEGYTVPVNTADIMPNTRGYEIWIGDDTYATGARTINMTGTLALGAISIPAPHIVKVGDPAKDGWTIMANPYASPVLWSNVQRTGAYDAAYRRKGDGTNIYMESWYKIAVGEAFWVHADTGGASIDFDPTDVNTTNLDQYNLRLINQEKQPMLALQLKEGGVQFDETALGFNKNAVDARERGVDAYKLPTRVVSNPNLSTMIGKNDFCKNILNSNTNTIVPIRIYTESPSGILKNYTLEINNVKTILKQNKKLVLEDRTLNTFTDLKDNISIPFKMMDNVTTPRFFLHVESPLTVMVENLTCNSTDDGVITVKTNQTGVSTYVWKNEQGKVIKQTSNALGFDKLENLTAGSYTVEVAAKHQTPVVVTAEIIAPKEITSSFTVDAGTINGDVARENGIITAKVGEEVKFGNNSIGKANYTWDFGDLATSSDKNAKHIYFNEGEYKVKLTSTIDKCKVSSNQKIKILPNNNSAANLLYDFNVIVNENVLLVNLNEAYLGKVVISIYNAIGQVVYENEIDADNRNTELIKLDKARGVYLINVKSDNFSKTKKIVLNN